MPQSSVLALAQSSDNVLWIGTLDGVASFDGKSIVPVPPVDGAPTRGVVTSMTARKTGGVYVASSAGVHVFDGVSWRLVATSRGASSIAEDSKGLLWMVDGAGALWTLEGNNSWRRHNETGESVIAVTASSDGSVWVSTAGGASHVRNGKAEAVAGPPLASRPAAILAAGDGRIWVATQGCTVHWTRGGADGWHQVAFAPWPRGAFRCLTEDRRGRIWAGSSGGHVAFGTAETAWTVWGSSNAPIESGVISILCDRQGSLWFGINGIGLSQWIGEEWSHRATLDPAKPTSTQYAAFGLGRAYSPDGLLVPGFPPGVLRLSKGGTVHYSVADGLTEDVRAVAETRDGTLIAGTRFGIFEKANGQQFRQVLKLPDGLVMGLFQSPAGQWYAATSTEGVFVREPKGWVAADSINASLDNKSVRSMLWRHGGDLWVATLRGITIFSGTKPPLRLASDNVSAIPESVNALLEISDDEIWAGGAGGIAVLHRGTWLKQTEADGLPGSTIYSLARGRDGAVWTGGSAGVGRFLNGEWRVWDSRSGLLQEECNLNGVFVAEDGSLYFGTMSGLARFDPAIKELPSPSLALYWRATPPLDTSGVAHLRAGDRSLHLRWSAPWLDPHPVQYRTRVPRLRPEWSPPSTDDHLDIENLGTGSWNVAVEARIEGAKEWTQPLILNVSVPPFWYETLAARVGFAVLLAFLTYAAVRWRLRSLRQHAAMLEKTVRERTAQLAEQVELLHESEQRALAASKAKSSFLANMSHELRTPLNGVLGFAQLLSRRKERDAEDKQGLDVIMSSGEHLLSLINNVLSLSKIEAGRITLDQTAFDLLSVVRDVENVLRFRAEEKHLRFNNVIDSARPPSFVIGDPVRVRQILINLVGNAIKFTETGSVTLKTSWSEDRALFRVIDTGPGIEPEELRGLFEPFVQSESGKRASEGTGLGLALSRNLATLMAGDITVESVPGKGSTFSVELSLPRARGDQRSVADERVVAALAPEEGEIRILVVDDNSINRTVLSRILIQTGFVVREAASGEEALELWRAWKPHFIWMDKRMRGLDGLEVTRRIRAFEETDHLQRVPIIALSASALDHESAEIFAAGCDDFVAKPFRHATIFAKLQQYLGVHYRYYDEPLADAPLTQVSPAAKFAGRVLVVDDDWICREVATEIVRTYGLEVITASSGLEALGLLGQSLFSLVFMDLQMPGMGGVETARRIKENPDMALLPVIALSAETPEGEVSLKESAFDDYLSKPIEPKAVGDILSRWLTTGRKASMNRDPSLPLQTASK